MLVAGLLLTAFLFAAGETEKPQISGLEVTIADGTLSVGFELRGAFDEELIERIQTGLPTGFDFRIRLVKKQRWYWWDGDLRSVRFHVVTMYNAVTGEYLVNYKRNGGLINSRVVGNLEELKDAMTRFSDLRVFDLAGLEVRKALWVQARAELGSRHLLQLIPVTVKTDWAESRQLRLPDAPQ